MSIEAAIIISAMRGDRLAPKISNSTNYKHWISIKDERRCMECANNHGKIWDIDDIPYPKPLLHPLCRCVIKIMQSIKAGTATINNTDGADWYLKFLGQLPEYYITKEDAKLNGWERGKWLSSFAPGKMIRSEVYKNRNGHLPQTQDRIWYEADINYKTGKRNSQRIIWSNDGLIFVTYDHYETFYEII